MYIKTIINMEKLTAESFKNKIFNYSENTEWNYKGKQACLVDFYTEWCGPCKNLAPILDDLSKEYDGKLNIYKVNTEEQIELAKAFGITSIPTLLFIPMDAEPQMSQGGMSKESLKQAFLEILKVE